MQHILDSILKDSLIALAEWPTWQAQAKAFCQCLGNENHRDFLLKHLAILGEGAEIAEEGLRHDCDTLATWQCHSLAMFTSNLCLLEGPLSASLCDLYDS